jgi:hypothetical protein
VTWTVKEGSRDGETAKRRLATPKGSRSRILCQKACLSAPHVICLKIRVIILTIGLGLGFSRLPLCPFAPAPSRPAMCSPQGLALDLTNLAFLVSRTIMSRPSLEEPCPSSTNDEGYPLWLPKRLLHPAPPIPTLAYSTFDGAPGLPVRRDPRAHPRLGTHAWLAALTKKTSPA